MSAKRGKQILIGTFTAIGLYFLIFSCLIAFARFFQSGYEYDVVIPEGCHIVEPSFADESGNVALLRLPEKKMDIIVGCDGHEYIWPVVIGDSGEEYGSIDREDLKKLKMRK